MRPRDAAGVGKLANKSFRKLEVNLCSRSHTRALCACKVGTVAVESGSQQAQTYIVNIFASVTEACFTMKTPPVNHSSLFAMQSGKTNSLVLFALLSSKLFGLRFHDE